MASLPQSVSESFKRLNPELYPAHDTPVAKEVIHTESARELQPRLRSGAIPKGDPVTPGGADPANNTRQFTIHADPVAAPRMTRRDKWLKPRRPCVQRYFDYRDLLQRAVGDLPTVPDELHCRFYIAMPESWSKNKRQEMEGKPHKQRPDRDNFDKAVCDALFLEDGGVWKGTQEKRWAVHGRVEIEMRWVTSSSASPGASDTNPVAARASANPAQPVNERNDCAK